jgi:hypothetical protein
MCKALGERICCYDNTFRQRYVRPLQKQDAAMLSLACSEGMGRRVPMFLQFLAKDQRPPMHLHVFTPPVVPGRAKLMGWKLKRYYSREFDFQF